MKKIILICALSLSGLCIAQNDTVHKDTLIPTESVAKLQCHDTTFIEPHPNSEDSVLVKTIVNGVMNIVATVKPEVSPVKNWIGAGIVALVLSIWGGINKRRRERQKKRLENKK